MKLFGPLVRPAKLIERHRDEARARVCVRARAFVRARVGARVCTRYRFHGADGARSVAERRTYIVTIIDLFYSSLARRARRAVAAARDRYSMRHLAVFRR